MEPFRYSPFTDGLKRLAQTVVALLFFQNTAAFALTNFVTTTPLREDSSTASYLLNVTDCHLLDRIEISAGDYNQSHLADFDPLDNTCRIAFTASGSGFTNPMPRVILPCHATCRGWQCHATVHPVLCGFSIVLSRRHTRCSANTCNCPPVKDSSSSPGPQIPALSVSSRHGII